jgi:NAD(P)-dependent dehydrogenase (short-subunit alcohol dehydrogenase family)
MKNIIITGATGNLGVATVKKILDSGYRVIAIDSHTKPPDFGVDKERFEFASVNLTNEKETADFIGGLILKYGKIDGAIMLVGGFTAGNMEVTDGEGLDKMFSLNFKTAYFTARPLMGHMKKNKYGRLVFIGARPALLAGQGKDLVAYALSKSLLFKLADFINQDTKGENIVATVVVPSTIDTQVNRQSMPGIDPDNWVKPEALADILEFILSDKASALRETVLKVYNNA